MSKYEQKMHFFLINQVTFSIKLTKKKMFCCFFTDLYYIFFPEVLFF